MPTIVDALVVTLGLDASSFQRSRRETGDGLRTFQRETSSAATDVERNIRRMQDAFSGVERSVMRLSTVFLGFAGGIGFVTFLGNVQKSIAELHRLSGMLGQSGRDLWAWQQVGAQVGATAEDITGSYQKMTQSLNDYLSGSGQLNAYFRWFAQRGVQFTKPGGGVASQTEIYTQLNRAVQGMDPQRQEGFLRNLGLGQGTVQMLMQSPEKLAADLARFKEKAPSAAEMKEAAIAQAQFNAAWSETLRITAKLGNVSLPLVNDVMKALVKIGEDTTKEIEKITKAFSDFDKWFSGTWIGRMAARILGEPSSRGNTPGNFDQRFGTWAPGQQGGKSGWRPSDVQGTPGGSNAGGSTSSAEGITTNEYLKNARSRNIAEINSDPTLKENTLKMLQLEEGNVGGKTGAMEALLNRTAMIQQKDPSHTIRKELFSGFYGPINRGQLHQPLGDAARRSSQAAFEAAAGGSNTILGRTDQGMIGDPNASGPGRVRVPGTSGIFNYWKGRRGGHQFTHEDSARFAEEQNRLALGSNMQSPVTAGIGGSNSGSTGKSWWDRMKGRWFGDQKQDGGWGNNLRAVPWLQPNGMSMIKGIPAPTYNNSSSAETHIGQFTVMTEPRSNPWSMAAQIKDAVQRSNIMDNSNSGPN